MKFQNVSCNAQNVPNIREKFLQKLHTNTSLQAIL